MYYLRFKSFVPVSYGVDGGFYISGPFETKAAAMAAQQSTKVANFVKKRRAAGEEVTIDVIKGDGIFLVGGVTYYG